MTSSKLDAKIPDGTLEQKWTKYRSTVPLVNPANKRSLEVIIVGSGLAGASAAASLA
jgi:succinate dehydrogenase / fumarate reductase flavoprotein subunit